MNLKARLRPVIKSARKRGALWVRVLDVARTLVTAEGRGLLWTRAVHGGEVHQTTPYTEDDRYPELFDLAASLAPCAARILSFGCSTGEELLALRRRFADAEIVGAEINPRSRRIAATRMATDAHASVVAPGAVEGTFDLVLALAVLQRQPHMIAEMEVENLSVFYKFERFDTGVGELVEKLRPGGLLCVTNAHYRIEDSSVADKLEPIGASPTMEEPLFGPDGRRLHRPFAHTIFRKRG